MTRMEFQVAVFTPNPATWKEFTSSPTGVIGSDLRRRGRKLVFLGAKSAQKESGKLARSISMQYFPTSNPTVVVTAGAKYAYFMHEGTHPHIIRPKTGRALRFKVKGRVVYARQVRHPGTRGSKFLSRHLVKVAND